MVLLPFPLIVLLLLCKTHVNAQNQCVQPGNPAYEAPCPVTQPVVTVGGRPYTFYSTGVTITPTNGPVVTVRPSTTTTIGTDTIYIGSTVAVVDATTYLFPQSPTSPVTVGPPVTTFTVTGGGTAGDRTITKAPVTSDGTTKTVQITILPVTGYSGTASGKTTGVTFISSSTSTSGEIDGYHTVFNGGSWGCTGPLCRPGCHFPLIRLLCQDNHGGGGGGFPPPPPGLPTPPPEGGTADPTCSSTATVPRCTVTVRTIYPSDRPTSSTTRSTSCSSITRCGATASTTTTSVEPPAGTDTADYDPGDWDGNEDWIATDQAYLGSLAAATDAPTSTYSATPTPNPPGSVGSSPLPTSGATPGSPVKAGTELRILPLGDSITFGLFSPDMNGYRLRLLNDLSGDRVVYAGTIAYGTMEDNYNEGYSGKTIQYIHDHYNAALDENPNIVLLMAGTNDMNQDTQNIALQGNDPSQAAARLASLIEEINNRLPAAVVLVALLTGVNDGQFQADHTAEFNSYIPGVVQARQDNGFKVATVDMTSVSGTLIRSGDVHPTGPGYIRMGDIWFNALHAIPSGWIEDPIGPDPDPSRTPINGGADGQGGHAAETPGTCPYENRNGYQNAFEYCPVTPIYIDNGLIGDGGALGPYLYGPVKCVSIPGDGRPICQCTKHDNYLNPNGAPSTTWEAAYADEIGGDCSGLNLPYTTAVRLADMDGDGIADYLYVREDSSVLGFHTINPPNQAHAGFQFHLQIAKGVIGHEHVTYDFRHEIQFADLNGDGLADYIWTHPNGRVEAWFQSGTGWCNLNANGFLYQGQIASGIGKPGYGVHHVDLNGDGRADYVYVAPDGTTIAWMNVPDSSFPGGIRYVNNGQIHGPSSVVGSTVMFADITGKGTPDYLMVESGGRTTMDFNGGPITDANDCHRYWQSHGVIATGAAPVFDVIYADMNGDGRAEYNHMNASNSAIGTYFASCPGNAPDSSFLWCRDTAPDGGDSRDDVGALIADFCGRYNDYTLPANHRAEIIGPHTSATVINAYNGPQIDGETIQQLPCIVNFNKIRNQCGTYDGSYIAGYLEYIIYRY